MAKMSAKIMASQPTPEITLIKGLQGYVRGGRLTSHDKTQLNSAAPKTSCLPSLKLWNSQKSAPIYPGAVQRVQQKGCRF